MGLQSATPRPGTRVLSGGFSDAGRVRSVNQDSFFVGEVSSKGYLALVADGMGGHQTGEVASQKAVETFRRELQRSRAHPPAAIARAMQIANHEVYNYALDHPEHRGMGTTLTALLVDDQVGLIGHVGDSRAYLIRDEEITLLTHDHSWVADRVRQGMLTEDEARRHRWRNVITNALGSTLKIRLDLRHFEIRSGDRVLLCSDGVSMLLSDTTMLQIVSEYPPEEAARKLVLEADNRGSPDNVTAVVVEVSSILERAKRYQLPYSYQEPQTIDLGETMSGIRKVEEDFSVQGFLSQLRRQSWYPYRGWLLGSLYLILLFVLFSTTWR